MQEPPRVDAERIERLRLWLLGILAVGLLGTVTELLLLEHSEKPLQFVPLILIAAAIGKMAWHMKRHDATSSGH